MGYSITEDFELVGEESGKTCPWGSGRVPSESIGNMPWPAPERRLAEALTSQEGATGIPFWLNRDPIDVQGGLNLYGFVGNDGVNAWDILGTQAPEEFVTPADQEAADRAAKAAEAKLADTIARDIEWCGKVCEKCTIRNGERQYQYTTTVFEGTNVNCDLLKTFCSSFGEGWKMVGWWHTQAAGAIEGVPVEDEFSSPDKKFSASWGSGYLANPDGTGRWDPEPGNFLDPERGNWTDL